MNRKGCSATVILALIVEIYGCQLLPEGFGNISSASMSLAVQRVLAQLYRGVEEAIAPVTDMIPEKE
jgi:hypothetical protein